MWAFAIWDSERRELFLSRDRFGVKPLRYLAEPHRFAFASELKAFVHLKGFTPRENVNEMRNTLRRGTCSLEGTLFEGVKRLPGGYNMLVSSRGMRTWRWWNTIDHLPSVPQSFPAQVEQFRELFLDAVRLRLRSDVRVASCLSGGLDSSSIVCSLPEMGSQIGEREARDFHHAFVATFDGTVQDEREYAEAAIERSGVQAHMVPIHLDDAIENLRQFSYDVEMAGAGLTIPHWLTYRELRRSGVVVSLDGHGADEMLGGYAANYRATLKSRGSWLQSPRRTFDLINTFLGLSRNVTAGQYASLVVDSDPILRGVRTALGRGRRFARRKLGWESGAQSSWAMPAEWAVEATSITNMDAETVAAAQALGPFKGGLYKEFHAVQLPRILRVFDRCAMAHGVEIRMPFMDWRLVCFAFALPEESIAGGGFTKRILREAMRGVLPEKIRTRKHKIGFDSPVCEWFNGGLGDWAWGEVQQPTFLDSPLWNGPAIRDFVGLRIARKSWTGGDARLVWRFLQAHVWRKAVFT